jgi:hypothetical protein
MDVFTAVWQAGILWRYSLTKLFQTVISDAEKLISIFDQLPSHKIRQQNEVLKRAALVMTLTALESNLEAFLLE